MAVKHSKRPLKKWSIQSMSFRPDLFHANCILNVYDMSYVNIILFNPIALRKAKIVYNFGLSECNRVKPKR